MGDVDDEITSSASESYPQEETSSNEGNPQNAIAHHTVIEMTAEIMLHTPLHLWE